MYEEYTLNLAAAAGLFMAAAIEADNENPAPNKYRKRRRPNTPKPSKLIEQHDDDDGELSDWATSKCRRVRSVWINDKRRKIMEAEMAGAAVTFCSQLRAGIFDYESYLRIDKRLFDLLLNKIRHRITSKDTLMRKSVPPEEKLLITLRYLVTGATYSVLESETNLSKSFMDKAIIQTCNAIIESLESDYLKFPQNKQQWHELAMEFAKKHQFPLCLGAVDMKHIEFTPLQKHYSLYRNDNGFESIILFAVADANSKFTVINVSNNGAIKSDQVVRQSEIMPILKTANKYLPRRKIAGNGNMYSYSFIATSKFEMHKNLLVPYQFTKPKLTLQNFLYNKRCKRVLKAIYRAFDLMFDQFDILQHRIRLNDTKTRQIIKCCCLLHNFLLTESSSYAQREVEEMQHADDDCVNPQQSQFEANRSAWGEYFINEQSRKCSKFSKTAIENRNALPLS